MKTLLRFSSILILFAALLLFALLPFPRSAQGCAAAPPSGVNVRITDESAVIIWDPARGIEHFIRRASFQTNAKDFGFLVPTPGLPQLATAHETIFDDLENLTRPPIEVRVRKGFRFTTWLFSRAVRIGPPTAVSQHSISAPSVMVLHQQQVGKYDAVVLEARNTAALLRWLKQHGYDSRPALRSWLSPYVAAHWKITAFKIARGYSSIPETSSDISSTAISSSAVCMSFKTTHPFFPYREPSDQRETGRYSPGRLLRIYLLASARMEGSLGLHGSCSGSSSPGCWPGEEIWANRIPPSEGVSLAQELDLSPDHLPAALWLTVFQDRAAPRPGIEDLYFSTSPSQASILPPPILQVEDRRVGIPLDVLALIIVLIALSNRLMARRMR